MGSDYLRQNSRDTLKQAQRFATTLSERTNWPIFTSPTGIICFESPKNLDQFIEQGVLSTAKRKDRPVYRVVFTSKHTKASAIIEKLRPYF